MNNYPNFKNFNFFNKNNEMKYPSQNSSSNLYDAYNGFIRGNMFKNIYDPYKIKEPFDVNPMNEQAKILTKIDALGFAMNDLNLYLDVFPNNQDMINLFNQYRNQKENLTNEYESKYGPLTIGSNSLDSYPWAWNELPWPWDN